MGLGTYTNCFTTICVASLWDEYKIGRSPENVKRHRISPSNVHVLVNVILDL
uniref:T7N9.29 n=1 Tax=Arabidopsis thaliana TaxID=3702 RepID=Q9LFW9_ARATH|nr:T7N9.29 [Arabidopsis thaliana]